MSQPIAFGHARWRVSILGVAGLCLGALMIGQSADMLDPAWHTEASRGVWMNHLPPLARMLLMFGLESLLLVIGIANLWAVMRRKPALIVDGGSLTTFPMLQQRRIVPWDDIVRIEDGNAGLLLHRTTDKTPLVIGYDWLDGCAEEIKSAIEKQWRSTRQM
jgi:hypothetical protein